ncbi:MAG: argininosuccinate lyase, partial [Actinomycetota bacterium]
MTTLWHGRFAEGPAESLWRFTVSLPFDQRLGPDDVVASMAHVRGLMRGHLVTPQEGDVLLAALDKVG